MEKPAFEVPAEDKSCNNANDHLEPAPEDYDETECVYEIQTHAMTYEEHCRAQRHNLWYADRIRSALLSDNTARGTAYDNYIKNTVERETQDTCAAHIIHAESHVKMLHLALDQLRAAEKEILQRRPIDVEQLASINDKISHQKQQLVDAQNKTEQLVSKARAIEDGTDIIHDYLYGCLSC